MTIKNKSKRLISLNYKKGKGWVSVPVGAGETVTEPELKDSDIAHFVKEGSLEEIKVDPVKDPVIDPVKDPVIDPVKDPVIDPVIDPVKDPVIDPVIDLVIDLVIDPDPIVLAEPVNEDTLKARTVEELKQYCKENKIADYSKKKESGLITLILNHLKPAE
jgi:hypothetical protein